MTEIIYSTQRTDFIAGRRYQNPRFFNFPVDGATRVYIVGDWPNVASAYARRGIDVVTVPNVAALGEAGVAVVTRPAQTQPVSQAIPETAYLRTAEPRSEQATVTITDGFRELPWTRPTEPGGATLRGLAASVSDVPVINRAQAIELIEAELERRKNGGSD